MSVDVASIERSARAALPALHEIAAPGWVIRVSGGTTKRVNSANPTRPGARLADVLAEAEATYAAHDLPCRFRLTPLADSDADRLLADAGYTAVDPSWTMVAPTMGRTIDRAVEIEPAATDAWLDEFAGTVGWSTIQRDAHAEVLAQMPRRAAVARIIEGERPIGWGIAAIGEGRACLYDIAVDVANRRRGVGRRLVESLLGWAADQGCGEAVLQVLDANAAARRLYAWLGFVDAYPYHYRIQTPSSRP